MEVIASEVEGEYQQSGVRLMECVYFLYASDVVESENGVEWSVWVYSNMTLMGMGDGDGDAGGRGEE